MPADATSTYCEMCSWRYHLAGPIHLPYVAAGSWSTLQDAARGISSSCFQWL